MTPAFRLNSTFLSWPQAGPEATAAAIPKTRRAIHTFFIENLP